MPFRLEFTGNDIYQDGAPGKYLGDKFGHGEAVSYAIEDRFVTITFTGGATRQIPVHRLLSITEK